MAASFNGYTFKERGGGGTYPTWAKKELLSIKQLAGNNGYTVQSIGEDVQTLALVARCTQAELTALFDQVLESGSLVYGYETHDAILMSIDSAAEQLAGKDTYFATLNFVRL